MTNIFKQLENKVAHYRLNKATLNQLKKSFGEFPYKATRTEITGIIFIEKGVKNEDLKLIGELTGLRELCILSNQISKIEGLDKLVNLGELNLACNQISKIEGLDKLNNLQVLNLAGNQITKIEGLNNLNNLRELDLRKNNIPKSQIDQFKAANKKIKVYV